MVVRNKITLNKKDGKEVKRKIKIAECKAVILHPSLGCPLIVEKGKPIRIYLLADNNFISIYSAQKYHFRKLKYRDDKYKDVKDLSGYNSNPEVRRTIARYLKISTFNDALKGKDSNTKKDKPIFTAEDAVKNIAVKEMSYYFGRKAIYDYGNSEKNGLETEGLKLEHFDADFSKIAYDHYLRKGLTNLFQIDIHNFEFDKIIEDSKGHSMFEISWITSDPKLKLHDSDLLERQDQYTNEFIKNKKYIKDTELTHAFKIKDDFKFEVDKDMPIQNYHPIYLREDKKPLNIGQLTDVHISSRQHAFIKSNAELIHGSNTNKIGKLVNTSYAALKNLMDQYGRDDKIDLLFFTGDLIDYNRNYHPKKFMSGELSKTGDIWKEMLFENMNQRNADGTPKKMSVEQIKARDATYTPESQMTDILPNNDDYPSSIDNVIIYSLFLYYIKKYQKPIFLISGNHECYTLPYGISPRVTGGRGVWKATTTWTVQPLEKQIEDSREDLKRDMASERDKINEKNEITKNGKGVGGNRANTGIPADHNLTFGEATLMYGPSYHQNLMFGKGNSANTQNYKPKNLDWFNIVFTPLSDYAFSWGKQTFIALDWGKGERMVVLKDSQREGAGGILPRATESISTRQWQLVNRAVKLNKPCTVLLTHFTLVNYDQFQAIKNPGLIDIDNWGDKHGKFDYGSFEKRREFVYQHIAENKIHFSLAGHSHRSALYQHTKMSRSYMRNKFEVNARTSDHATMKFDKNKYQPDKAKIIVSASGGSIPIQNHDNELAGWGLDVPSGSYIYFNDSGTEDEIGIKRAKVAAAQPRLAVALDFADVLGYEEDNTGGFMKRFESIQDNGEITLEINPKLNLPDIEWIKEITLYQEVADSKPLAHTTTLKYQQGQKYIFKITNTKLFNEESILDTSTFISIKSNGKLNGSVYSHYNQTSPWQFRIEIIPRKKLMKNHLSKGGIVKAVTLGMSKTYYGWYKNSGTDNAKAHKQLSAENGGKGPKGFYFNRHSRFGETPKHQDYSNNFSSSGEYVFNWASGKKAGDSK